MSLDEAKELELQARCCAERLELASWSIWTTRPHLQYYHHVMCAEMTSKWAWHIQLRAQTTLKQPKHPPTVNPGSATAVPLQPSKFSIYFQPDILQPSSPM